MNTLLPGEEFLEEMKVDEKELASRTLADVIKKTREMFPDKKYQPKIVRERPVNALFGIETGQHAVAMNCDGIGTKPELAERLFDATGDYKYMESIAFDGAAMVVDDAARFGLFTLGIGNSLDVNSARDGEFIAGLSQGLYKAAKVGRFAVLNGETAELKYRSPGYGKNHLNWNMTALTLMNKDKVIDGSNLKPGQVVVAFREKSIRSNGLSKAREILERAYLKEQGLEGKIDFISAQIWAKVYDLQKKTVIHPHLYKARDFFLETPMGQQMMESVQLPWHESFPDLTAELLKPSTIYSQIVYEALGGVDGEVELPIVACAHISGGGVPLKAQRMLEEKGLGLDMGTPFEDPAAVKDLIELAKEHPDKDGKLLVDERTASEQWNRGVGFLCVVEDEARAKDIVDLAFGMGFEASIAGRVTNEKTIKYRGESWKY